MSYRICLDELSLSRLGTKCRSGTSFDPVYTLESRSYGGDQSEMYQVVTWPLTAEGRNKFSLAALLEHLLFIVLLQY
jgi:hypothetical protein